VDKSKFKPLWDFLLFCALFIEILLVPYTVCIPDTEGILERTRVTEFAIDIFFVLNIWVNAFSGKKSDG